VGVQILFFSFSHERLGVHLFSIPTTLFFLLLGLVKAEPILDHHVWQDWIGSGYYPTVLICIEVNRMVK
jgi:hypothetical protein